MPRPKGAFLLFFFPATVIIGGNEKIMRGLFNQFALKSSKRSCRAKPECWILKGDGLNSGAIVVLDFSFSVFYFVLTLVFLNIVIFHYFLEQVC